MAGAMKVGVVGAGAVGSACLMSLVLRGSAREIVIVDRTRKRALAVATDLRYGAALSPPVDIRDGDYADLTGSALVMVTAGVNEKSGGATDPPDPLADFVRSFGFKRVLSSGTFLDSLRFRFHLAQRLKVDPTSVHAQVLGEHGTSEVLVWSTAGVAGAPVFQALRRSGQNSEELRTSIRREVRYANIAIIEGNRASQYGIGIASARIAEAVLRDERIVIPIGSYNPNYGVTLSVPSVLGREGVVKILEPELAENERQALQRSAETLKSALAHMKQKG